MTEPRDDLSEALQRLRREVHHRVPVPAAAGIRAWAIRRQRVRRTTTVLAATVAIAALLLGGTTLMDTSAAPPEPPADTPSVTPAPSVSPTPVSPSPRPAPLTPEPLDDPIVEVDWFDATVTIPPRDGCPEGPVSLTTVGSNQLPVGPADGSPKVILNAIDASYGDLTGDGNAEAVVQASCAESEEGLASADGYQLLVVSRQDDGALVGLAWVGPPDALFLSYWVVGDRLLIDADPATVTPEDSFPRIPGLALAYQWDGEGFTGWEVAADYPPIAQEEGLPAPVRPGPAVASALGCPDDELRFVTEPGGDWWTASGSDATFAIPVRPFQPYLLDLDRTGDRLLVVPLRCDRGDAGDVTQGLAVFERAGEGWEGISVLVSPGQQEPVSYWVEGDRFVVEWSNDNVNPSLVGYRWTGTVFEPIDE